MAFMHGAQDGQKFMGVMLLGICMVNGSSNTQGVQFPLWMLLLGSAAMALGTSIGGKKSSNPWAWIWYGWRNTRAFPRIWRELPVFSDFHFWYSRQYHTYKTTAIMGVGAVKRLSAINFSVVKDMVMTWVMTFPGCGIIGFLIAKLFMMLFHG